MKMTNKITINHSIDVIWKLLADDFDKADLWMAGVPKSYAKEDGALLNEAPMIGRVCEFTSKADGPYADETITFYDKVNYCMDVEVVPRNVKVPVEKNCLNIKLIPLGKNQTKVIWDSDLSLKPKGILLYPIVRFGISKSFKQLLEELKYFVETGLPHPRKVTNQRKAFAA
ncbi:MAG: SRPBCC family protein [Flavobacteriales bacterium]|nr:SRPBCC family protein [Flavobacteriales bacterium]